MTLTEAEAELREIRREFQMIAEGHPAFRIAGWADFRFIPPGGRRPVGTRAPLLPDGRDIPFHEKGRFAGDAANRSGKD